MENTAAAVIWKDSALRILPNFSSGIERAQAVGINNRGDVVGNSQGLSVNSGLSVATLWHHGVAYNLRDLVAEDDPLKTCMDLRFGQAINDRGQIAVSGVNHCENEGPAFFILSPGRRRE